MKLRITTEEFEALSDEFKAEYKQSGEHHDLILDRDVFTTEQVDEKISGLTSKRDELLGKLKTAKEELEAAKTGSNKGSEEDKRLIQEAKDRIEALEKEIEQGKAEGQLRTIQDELKKELGKVSEGKALEQLFRLTKDRVGIHDGKGTVLTEDGRPTISSVKELVQKIKDSGDYDNLIIGSKGKGGNERGSKGGNSGEKWSDFTTDELSKIQEENPERYEALKKTRGKS